ncbi:MAG TPA: DUF3293 domain-containing protein [Acidimicrobiales bacterium]|nr:DUF3293 domain-containing protein [Acidimicrobiales bacterium]
MELLPPEDPWASYARTVVVIVRPDATNLAVEGAPPGQRGAWPWPTDAALYVLTAWDPGDARPTEDDNRTNQAALEAELRGLGPDELWDAVGVDPVSGHREEGVAVRGLPLGIVLDIGARYGQDAIFEWTPPAWGVVACDGDRRSDFGWTATPESAAGPGTGTGATFDVLRGT